MNLIIGSRGSDLALYQANLIRSYLTRLGASAEIKIIKTTGDKIDTVSFDKMEGKSFFTKELEEALLAREIDLAVHSLKDLSTQMPDGLTVGAYCNPQDPAELLLVRPDSFDPGQLMFVKTGATIGTSSVRRQAQIAYFRSDLNIVPLRGNVPTRVKRLQEGKYDAILIARAGVERLKLDTGDLKVLPLPPLDFIPAPGQGILAIEIREGDKQVQRFVGQLDEEQARQTAVLERGLLARFQGGCQLPLAVTTIKRDGGFYLKAFLGIQKDNGWGKPARYSGYGENIGELIERAYACLSKPNSQAEAGKKARVLITRSQDESVDFGLAIGEAAEVVHYPVYTINPVTESAVISQAMARIKEYGWIIFTSKNSVRIFETIQQKHNVTLAASIKIAAVGGKTAAYLKSRGYTVSFVPEREDATGLVQELPAIIGATSAMILLPQGEEAPDTLEKGLQNCGHKIDRMTIYTTMPTPKEKLSTIKSEDIGFFVFTSPLAVEYYKSLGHDLPKSSWVASIGRPTAAALTAAYRVPDYIPLKADLEDIANRIREQV